MAKTVTILNQMSPHINYVCRKCVHQQWILFSFVAFCGLLYVILNAVSIAFGIGRIDKPLNPFNLSKSRIIPF